jgi:multiple sugar transport system permease protein
MSFTAFKDYQQVISLDAAVLPMQPKTFNYEGQDYPLKQVTINGVVRELALVEKYNDESNFIDPSNPAAGVINWKGYWGTLPSVMVFSPTFENFPKAWDQVAFARLFRNTFIIAILGTIGTVLSSTAVAYGFSRFRIPFKRTIFIILIATIILPSQVTLIPTYAFFRSIGWGGTWLPLIIPHFFANAYNVFLLRQYFMGIPKDLDEAAMIDGASPFRTLLSIILPQSMPALMAVSLFHFFFAWNDFFMPLVYLSGKEELYPIAVGLTQFNNIYQTQPGFAMAAAIMAIALPVTIFFFAQRAFMQGIVITGVEK